MPTLKDTFVAREQDLNDMLADQSNLLAVQALVFELFNHANQNRIEGIIEEIQAKYGAFAIPGIISASYIQSGYELNNTTINRIAALVTTLAKDNTSACRMILRNGITRNPFESTHKIFLKALDQLEYKPDEAELKQIQDALLKALKEANNKRALSFFQLLLPHRIEVNKAESQAQKWFNANFTDDAAKLTNLLLRNDHQRISHYVTQVIAYDYDNAAPESIQQHIELETDDTAISAIEGCILALHPGRRNKQIEYFCTGPLARRLNVSPSLLTAGDRLIRASGSELAERYWWQAVSHAKSAASVEYMTSTLTQMCKANQDFAVFGIVQLMYLGKNPKNQWAVEQLNDIQSDAPALYEEANEIFTGMGSGKKRVRQTSNQVTKTTIQQKGN
jgi:hypothetical protein